MRLLILYGRGDYVVVRLGASAAELLEYLRGEEFVQDLKDEVRLLEFVSDQLTPVNLVPPLHLLEKVSISLYQFGQVI